MVGFAEDEEDEEGGEGDLDCVSLVEVKGGKRVLTVMARIQNIQR